MAKLAPCKTCKKEVSTNAKSCPHCGESQPTQKKGGGCGTTIFLLIAAIFVFGLINSGNKDQQLANSSTDKATTNLSEFPKTSQPTENAKSLIDKEELLNDECRGGNGDDPKTMAACDERDKVFNKLKEIGWCWGPDDAIGADKKWIPCNDAITNGKKDASQKDQTHNPASKQKTNQVKIDCSLFDGYKLGMTIDEFKANYYKLYQINDLIEKSDMSLSNGDRTYKVSAPIIMNMHQVDADFSFSPNKKLFWISVYIEPSDFNDIKSYLISVFGSPEKSTAPDSYELWPETSSKGRIIMLQAVDNVGLATKQYLITHGKAKMGNIVLSAGNSCQTN
ncbi:MAG: hypothetical protein KGZ69_02155 [Methylomonas sp.]|nr:hypothetical protein [Methylomonas sp.]